MAVLTMRSKQQPVAAGGNGLPPVQAGLELCPSTAEAHGGDARVGRHHHRQYIGHTFPLRIEAKQDVALKEPRDDLA